MINDMLDLVQIDEGKIQISQIPFTIEELF